MGGWAGGGAGGWSSNQGHMRPTAGKRAADGWDDDELGKVYDHRVIKRLIPYLAPYKTRRSVLHSR